jgi:surface protein
MNEMFSGVINLRVLDLTSFDTTNLVSWTDMWKDITNLNITIDLQNNPNILKNKPEGIVIIDI